VRALTGGRVQFENDIQDVVAFGSGADLDQLRHHLKPEWIEDALKWSGTTSVRRRRLPADQVVWLVLGMALFRREPIERVVDLLDLAVPDSKDSGVAKSAIAQARQRLSHEPLRYLFEITAAAWSTRSAEANTWRGLTLYGMDGSTLRVADTPENREEFGNVIAADRGVGGYPLVRVVAMMALRSHVLSSFRFGPYTTGETVLARELWNELPPDSLVLIDRGFLVKKDLYQLERTRDRHWLTRSKVNTKWAIVEKLGKDDYLVELKLHEPGMPSSWVARAIHYKWKGHARSTILTSLTDAEKYPAKELIALYHERWETELAYDEVKTHLLERQESLRSKTPDGVRQELWGIATAYNLVRVEMERVAAEAKVSPLRISFTGVLAVLRDEMGRMGGPRFLPGTIPKRLQGLRRDLKRLVLPPRRPERSYPRAVKIKMSNYLRKRPETSALN
jgi:Insertion element 4 transposase N-terminal/Transposase DDE domain